MHHSTPRRTPTRVLTFGPSGGVVTPRLHRPVAHALAEVGTAGARWRWGGVAFALLVLALPGVALTQADGSDIARTGSSYTTVANDSLWRLAGLALGNSRGDRTQAMVAILRHNPAAFMQGNMHRLRRGVDITLPSPEAIAAEDPNQASMLLESHLQALTRPDVMASPPAPLLRKGSTAGATPDAAPRQPAPIPAPLPAPPLAKAPVAATTPPAPTVKPPPVVAAPPAIVVAPPIARTPAPAAPAVAAAPVPAPTPAPVAIASAPVVAATPAIDAGSRAPAAAASQTSDATAATASSPVVAAVGASAAMADTPPARPAATPPAATAEPGLALSTRLLPYVMLLLLLALPVSWWLNRRWVRRKHSLHDRLRVASTDFQDSKDASRGLKPKRVDVSNAGVETARAVETLRPVTALVTRVGEPVLPGAAPLSSAELREQASLKLEIAIASLEIGRALVARTLLGAVQREGDAAERQVADEMMLKLA